MFDEVAELRRCPSCREPRAGLAGETEHVANVTVGHIVPVGDVEQGSSLRYTCEACSRSFVLLDRGRRAWFWYGIVLGGAMGGFAIWLRPMRESKAALLLLVAAIALVTSAVFVARDYWLRARTRLG